MGVRRVPRRVVRHGLGHRPAGVLPGVPVHEADLLHEGVGRLGRGEMAGQRGAGVPAQQNLADVEDRNDICRDGPFIPQG